MAFHDLTMKSIHGNDVALSDYKGQHCLVVNVASLCGLTRQYKGLVALQSKHAEQGLTILGFPCNQFSEQEPGTDAEICEFAKSQFEVNFPMFSKIEVNGDGRCELYSLLVDAQKGPSGEEDIQWNFTKFLVDPSGNVVKRYEPGVHPRNIAEDLRNYLV